MATFMKVRDVDSGLQMSTPKIPSVRILAYSRPKKRKYYLDGFDFSFLHSRGGSRIRRGEYSGLQILAHARLFQSHILTYSKKDSIKLSKQTSASCPRWNGAPSTDGGAERQQK